MSPRPWWQQRSVAIGHRALERVYREAPRESIDDSDRLVIIGDCHRGDGGWADEFRRNKAVYLTALRHYLAGGYTYVEIGDGDDLWRHRRFDQVREAHRDVFDFLRRFHEQGRLRMVYGNHDIQRRDAAYVAGSLHGYVDEVAGTYRQLLDGIVVSEGLVLEHRTSGSEVLCVHGHQVDVLSSHLWRLSQFFIGHVWWYLQRIGFKHPIGAAVDAGPNVARAGLVERQLLLWISKYRVPLICGHTHRPASAVHGWPPYFNAGSCLHPDGITAVEIRDGGIELVKWQRHGSSIGGDIQAARTPLASLVTFGSLLRAPSPA
jgi:hypothetical protein